MNQRDAMRAFAADALVAFADAGLADAALWHSASGAGPVACTVMVDRDVHDLGDDSAPLTWPHVIVTLPLIDGPAPSTGDHVTLTASGETWRLESRLSQDEACSQWVVSLESP